MIGIYAPYTYSDTALMATGLADLAISLGYSTSIFSYVDPVRDIHLDWDNKVKSDRDTAFRDWVKQCSHIVWFSHHVSRFNFSRGLNKHRNTLVVLTNQLTPTSHFTPDVYDCVLVPSLAAYESLHKLWNKENMYALPWDPGYPLFSKSGFVANDKTWVYVPISRAASETFGFKLICTLDLILGSFPRVHITIAKQCRMAPDLLEELEDLRANYPTRVRLVKAPRAKMLSATYRQHDWTLFPKWNDHVCLPAISSLYNGTPVVSLDSAPIRECVIPGHSGHLLAGGNELPSVHTLVDGLSKSIGDTAYFQKIVTTPWPFLETRRRTFTGVWRTIWKEPNSA